MPDDLIPLGVRIAVRNAVGGWGPYTVREIDDLFQSHGFIERADHVGDAGGTRRTEAEAHHARIDFNSPEQARRYLDLIDEVLEYYPADAPEPSPTGQKLRRELQRAGFARSRAGRLQLPGAENRAVRSLEEATDGVWSPDRIRVFMSHTSAHKVHVARLAKELDGYAFSCFVAHDAIEPSRQWQEVIELALRTCDVLTAYVTEDFALSRWADQEVGWALGRDIVVVPLKVGADPYGFFGSYQAVPVRVGHGPRDTAIAVTRAIAVAVFGQQRPGAARLLERMTDLVVEAFCRSSSDESMRRRFELLTLIPRSAWKEDHFQRLEHAASGNSQIREGSLRLHGVRTNTPEAIAEMIGRLRGDRRI